MNALTYKALPAETLIVTRDGSLDESYYEEIWQERRAEIIHEAAHKAVSAALQVPVTLGRVVVWLVNPESRSV